MWEIITFDFDWQMNEWQKANYKNYAFHQIFLNNVPFAIEVKKLKQI